jgi:hypothetical protein
MRLHQPVGVVHRNNCHINVNDINNSNGNGNGNINYSEAHFRINATNGEKILNANVDGSDKCLQTIKSIISDEDSECFNDFDARTVNARVATIETILNFKAGNCEYFKNFKIGTRQDFTGDTGDDLNGNGNESVVLIETLNLTEDNLSRVSVLFLI